MSAKPKHLRTVVLATLVLGLAACGGQKPAAETAVILPDEPATPTREAPKASALVSEGEALLAQGDAKGAKAKFEQQLATDRSDVRAWLGLGLSEELLGDPKAAENAYREAIAIDPKQAEAHNNLGLLLRDEGRLEDAIAELEAATMADPKMGSAHANLALAYEDAGRTQQAGAAYAAAVKLTPQDGMLRLNHGLFLLKGGAGDAALVELRAAAAHAQGDRAVLVGAGNGLRRAGKADEAVRALEAAIGAGDGKATPALLSELSLAQHAAGLKAEAKASLEQALKLDPKYASAHYVLASMLASEGNKRAAIDHYQRCIDADPKGELAARAKEKLKAARAMK